MAPSSHANPAGAFAAPTFLRAAGAGTAVVVYQPGAAIFSQGDTADSVMYVQEGTVKLSVVSRYGKEAVLALMGPGAFLGEQALSGQLARVQTATAMTKATVLVVPKQEMVRLLRTQATLVDQFIAHMLSRNNRIQDDLAAQLLHNSEKRLARALLLLAGRGKADQADGVLPPVSQETLAEMIGSTRTRVNFFMMKFKKLGFIEDNGGLTVKQSLLTVIQSDGSRSREANSQSFQLGKIACD